MTNAEARFSKSLRPRKPEGSLGRTAQDVHLDSHTAPELWALGCFYSHISTRTFRKALPDRVAGQLRGDKECPFSGVTKSGRVWRKVPESDARSVISTQTFRRALTASMNSCAEIKSIPLVA